MYRRGHHSIDDGDSDRPNQDRSIGPKCTPIPGAGPWRRVLGLDPLGFVLAIIKDGPLLHNRIRHQP